jgi:nuclear-control-of-ATPase protein 2
LLLVQVQQLKVGMLNAVEDINVLIEGNKLNVRALSTIPAFVIVWFTSRLLARNLYNLRSRDLRHITVVHEEMTEHLTRMKSIILLAKGGSEEEEGESGDVVSSSVTALNANELGEIALSMHCYLVLLDYCSPQPFGKSYCDDIHRSMREVLGSLRKRGSDGSGVTADRPLALVDIVLKKHEDLRRHL